jgi:hypothetical protein
MSGQSEDTGGHKLTAVLGSILLLAEIPIRLMEHYHLLHSVETSLPQLYALITSPSAAVARSIVGLLMIGWVIFEYRKHHTGIRPAQDPPAPMAQPTIHFAPVIQNIQNVAPIGAVEPAQALRHQPRPNLIFLHARIASVTFDNGRDQQFFYESRIQDRDDPRVVLACFRNEPAAGGAVIDAELVRAQVVYRNEAGQEIGLGIPRACWLNENADMVDFRVGDSQCAILILMRADGLLLMPWMHRTRSRDGYGDVVSVRNQAVNEAIRTIEVRVLSDEYGMIVRRVFTFASADGQLRIEEQPAPA